MNVHWWIRLTESNATLLICKIRETYPFAKETDWFPNGTKFSFHLRIKSRDNNGPCPFLCLKLHNGERSENSTVLAHITYTSQSAMAKFLLPQRWESQNNNNNNNNKKGRGNVIVVLTQYSYKT